MNDTVTLTAELIHAASSHPTGNGFTKQQLAVFGIAYPPRQGWLRSLVGTKVTLETLAAFRKAGDAKRAKNAAKAYPAKAESASLDL